MIPQVELKVNECNGIMIAGKGYIFMIQSESISQQQRYMLIFFIREKEIY